MSERRLTDAQIATALRTRLPTYAQASLAGRIMDAVDTTPQQSSLPAVLGRFADADPLARRGSLLIAAAVLLGLALASAALIGGSRVFERDAIPIDLAPPSDVPALVRSTYDRMSEMPPATVQTLEDGTIRGRLYVGSSGAVRIERFQSADATEPATYEILEGTTRAELAAIGTDRYWVQQEGAISEDPRVFLLAELQGRAVGNGLGCGLTPNEGDPDASTAVSGWAYVGAEAIIGRPTYHVRCAGGDLWIDAETRLILRSEGPAVDADFQPVPGVIRTIEVTGLDFDNPPANLFDLAPPPGVVSLSLDDYRCRLDVTACPPTPTPTALPSTPPGSDRLPPLVPTTAVNGWIAFSTDGQRPGSTDDAPGSDLYLVQPGSTPTMIAGRDGGATRNACPAFSPDGGRLAFGVATGISRAVIVGAVSADGALEDPVRLEVPGSGLAPCAQWSTDGTRLAYVDGEELVVRGLDGSTLPAGLGDPRVEDFARPEPTDPLLSPSGDRSVRVEFPDTGCRLVFATPDGSAAETVPLGFCPYAVPTWSPDGRQVLLMEDISGHDFTIHSVTAERPFEATIVAAAIRTNGARSWPGRGDVSWQGSQP